MDKLMREFGKSLQKELITKLIAASQDAFDKDTFFTEDNLTAIFDSSCSEMKKSTKKAAKKSKKKKDPSQPSRTNTWMVYSNEQRPIVKAANPNAKFQDIGKIISTQWKALSDEFADSDYGSLDNLIIYTVAKDLAVDVLKWAESVPAKAHTKNFQEFVGDSLKIGAKLAGGYSFGFEPEYLGANIAYTKKALACANQCLSLMTSLKSADYFTKAAYGDLNSRLFELRNDIGVYVQELRDRFRFGID